MYSKAKSVSGKYRAKMKLENPEKYEAYLEKERIRKRKMQMKMAAKKKKKKGISHSNSGSRMKPSIIPIIQSLGSRIPVVKLRRVDENEVQVPPPTFRKDCEMCKISFWSKVSFNYHLQECIKVKSETLSSNQVANFELYIKTSITEIKLVCPVCSEQFNSILWMSKHLARHKTDIPYWCAICNTNYKERLEYLKHLSQHRSKIYQCTICNDTFRYKQRAKNHVNNHLGIRPFSCHLCDKSYTTKCHLSEHVATHVGYKPFHCEVCGKGFYVDKRLNNHKRNMHSMVA